MLTENGKKLLTKNLTIDEKKIMIDLYSQLVDTFEKLRMAQLLITDKPELKNYLEKLGTNNLNATTLIGDLLEFDYKELFKAAEKGN